MQQDAAPVCGDVDVLVTVVVVVSHGAAEEVAGELVQSSIVRYFREVALAVSLVERELWPNEQDIEVAVVVVVEQRAPVADGLEDGERTLALHLPLIVQARGVRHIREGGAVHRLRGSGGPVAGRHGCRAVPAASP